MNMKQIRPWQSILFAAALASVFPSCIRSAPENVSTEAATPTKPSESIATDVGATPPIHPTNKIDRPESASVSGDPLPGNPELETVPLVIGSGNFNGHRDPVVIRFAGLRFLRVSPNGQYAATVRQVNRTGALLQVREISSGQVQHEYYEPSGMTAMEFDPTSQSIAYGAGDHSVVLQSLDGTPASRWPGHRLSIGDIAFSPDGKWLASFGHDNRLLVWDAAHATMAAEASDSTTRFALQVRFVTPERLWTRSPDGFVRWYDFTGDRLSLSQEVKLPDDFVVAATDGEKFYGMSPSRSLRILDAFTGRDLPVPQTDGVVTERILPRGVSAVSSRSRDLAIFTSGTQLSLWAGGDPRQSQSWELGASDVSLMDSDQDGRVWAAYSGSEGLLVFDRERPDSMRRIEPESRIVLDRIISPRFSPDGATVVSLHDANTVAVLEIATGLTRRQFSRPAAIAGAAPAIATVLLAGHQNEVFCGTGAGGVEILSDDSHASPLTVSVSNSAVTALATSSDGEYLVAGDASGSTAWVELRTSTRVKSMREQNAKITAADISPNRRLAATASEDRTVVLWNVATQSPTLTLRDFTHAVQALKFSPASDWLACGDEDGTVSVWSVESGQQVWSTTLRESISHPRASGAELLENLTATFKPEADARDSGNESKTGIVSIAFSRDQRVLAVGTASGYTQTIDLVHWTLLAPVFQQAPVSDLTFAADAASLLVATTSGDVARWWRAPDPPVSLAGHQGSVRFAVLDSSGQRGVTGGVDGQLIIWNVDQGTLVQSLGNEGEAITTGALAPDGRRAVSGSYGSGVVFWDLVEMKRISKRYGHKGRVWSFSFSPDGNLVASGCDDQTVKLWDFATQKILRTIDQGASVRFLRFSPDAKQIVTCTIDPRGWQFPAQMRLWETATGKLLVEYKGHQVAVNAAVFSADGHELTSCDADGRVCRWKVLTGNRIDQSVRPSGLSHAGLIRDGRCLVMRRFNNGLFIDTADSLARLSEVDVPTLAISDMNVASAGNRIIVGTEEGVAYVWSIGHE